MLWRDLSGFWGDAAGPNRRSFRSACQELLSCTFMAIDACLGALIRVTIQVNQQLIFKLEEKSVLVADLIHNQGGIHLWIRRIQASELYNHNHNPIRWPSGTGDFSSVRDSQLVTAEVVRVLMQRRSP